MIDHCEKVMIKDEKEMLALKEMTVKLSSIEETDEEDENENENEESYDENIMDHFDQYGNLID